MRAFVVTLVALLVTAPAALADSVTATGTAGLFGAVDVHAQSGPGGSASGQIATRWNATGSKWSGEMDELGHPIMTDTGAIYIGGTVTCVEAHGNVAVLNFEPAPQLTDPTSMTYGVTTVRITDNAGTGKRDSMMLIPATGSPQDCSLPDWAHDGDQHFTEGDAVVVDDTPRTAYASSCRKAGGRRVGSGKKRRCVPVRASACKGKAYKRKFGFKKRSRCVAAARRARQAR